MTDDSEKVDDIEKADADKVMKFKEDKEDKETTVGGIEDDSLNLSEGQKKNIADVENIPNETTRGKPWLSFDLEEIKEGDISQYLWDTLIKYINKANKYIHDKIFNDINSSIGKYDRGPAKPEASKPEKVKHSAERAKDIYKARDDIVASPGLTSLREAIDKDFTEAVSTSDSSSFERERESLQDIMVRAQKIAYDSTLSEFLHEKMTKDKDFNFATMAKEEISKQICERIAEKHNKLMSGVMATFYYSTNIELLPSQRAMEACQQYLDIRENESQTIKDLILQDLEKGNFRANDKNPSRALNDRIKNYAKSFARESLIIPTAVEKVIDLVDKNSLSEDEKIGLDKQARVGNLFQSIGNQTTLVLTEQIKAIEEEYRKNKSNPTRDRIAAMKEKFGKNIVSEKMIQENPNNSILRAVQQARSTEVKR